MYPSRLDYIVDKPPVRQPRRDAILRRLPDHQRALVHKWLFDKALTYAQVAQACFDTFQLEISKSSVARYYHSEMADRRRQATRKPVTPATNYDHLTPAEQYDLLEHRVLELALHEGRLPQELMDVRLFIRLGRVAIAFRRERNQRERVRVARLKAETQMAKAVLKHLREEQARERRKQAALEKADWLPGPTPGTKVPFTWPADAGYYRLGHDHPLEVALRRECGLPET